ncbi:leucine-rich repeat-containing protein 14B-like isoform X1 [Argopecten irradians]|uniref:leucine-rich repeat-containing protein 14B-like isoform X1 n=1 Tax=Argopecten irradians TaxID=31199 RepID=UPI0037163FF8
MFKALDKVNYDNLVLNHNTTKAKEPPKPDSLVNLSCYALNKNPSNAERAIKTIPTHLAPCVLRAAVEKKESETASVVLSNWPLKDLCFKEILGSDHPDIFQQGNSFYFDLIVFRGIRNRTKYCKITTVDFRGFKLNPTFCQLVIQMWPLMSLKKSQIKPKYLAKVIAKTAGLNYLGVAVSQLTDEVLPRLLFDRAIEPRYRINIPRGERMVVKLDSIQFTNSNTLFLDYLICNCLRSITPVYVSVSNIYIRSDPSLGDAIAESLAPFIVLRGHDMEYLEGISLKQLEDGIFFMVCSDIQKFSHLRALDLQDCNIYLQEGRTRSRTSGRLQMVSTLSSFVHLTRLDLGFNYLLGCLGELLDALKTPLEYLSVRGCDLNEDDLTALAESKHAKHLRELNLSKVCQFSIYENDRISPVYLLRITKHFPNVNIFNLTQNHLPDACISEFCTILTQNLTKLKALDISGNILTENNLLDITRSVGKLKTMQWFRFTCASNLLEEPFIPFDNSGEMKKKFCDTLASVGRHDIKVDLVKLSYAIFVDLLDVMD